MDFDDIQKVNLLSSEKIAIQQARELMDQGSRIIEMGIGHVATAVPNVGTPFAGPLIRVQTGYIEYPPQMIEAIKAAFQVRLQAIEDELTKLGVTGMPSARR